MSLKISGKESRIDHLQFNTYHNFFYYGAEIVKLGPADPEIICLREIIKAKKERNFTEGKIYSPVGRFAERAK